MIDYKSVRILKFYRQVINKLPKDMIAEALLIRSHTPNINVQEALVPLKLF